MISQTLPAQTNNIIQRLSPPPSCSTKAQLTFYAIASADLKNMIHQHISDGGQFTIPIVPVSLSLDSSTFFSQIPLSSITMLMWKATLVAGFFSVLFLRGLVPLLIGLGGPLLGRSLMRIPHQHLFPPPNHHHLYSSYYHHDIHHHYIFPTDSCIQKGSPRSSPKHSTCLSKPLNLLRWGGISRNV